MSGVTGPISSLPGSVHALADGAACDSHPDRPAVRRIQGETDSFGCEMMDLCAECLAEIHRHAKRDRSGRCDWCKRGAADLRAKRDWEEGSHGPVYYVCGTCSAKHDKRVLDHEDWMRENEGWR